MLHSMTIGLIHVDQLETLYLCYGGQVSIGGHWGQKVIFSKNATSATEYLVLTLINVVYLCYVTQNMHELETPLHSFTQV